MLFSASQRGFAKHRSHACFPALAMPNAHTCFATGALAPQVLHPAGGGHLPENAGMARGCRTNQGGCRKVTTALFGDLAGRPQLVDAHAPRLK